MKPGGKRALTHPFARGPALTLAPADQLKLMAAPLAQRQQCADSELCKVVTAEPRLWLERPKPDAHYPDQHAAVVTCFAGIRFTRKISTQTDSHKAEFLLVCQAQAPMWERNCLSAAPRLSAMGH
ncbi:hypothetical protein AT574_11505 [Phaeobacter inhibens]|nr:hypothetical protein AT574_11505 [Phaeobacter inhibens]